ncbi:M15 family metallopeptidase [Serinibacter arcticus]|uniref:D-alanyl-D-alanine carboxypeptidase n=1 Tax=Serinibacter arcticus TaxID=1655435 RepID=A0A4Z1E8K5_9MICO|nr:M15 family metallopeptidase [Serinibacter arcticus]TGO05907.1 D-alanyl-D-alanine carboxypeptidase [Serinibacter arcticus]
MSPATYRRRRRVLAVALSLVAASGVSAAHLGERSASAERITAVRDSAVVTEQGMRVAVDAARSELELEVGSAAAVLAGTDLDTPAVPEGRRGLANDGVDPAAVEQLRAAVADAESALAAPVELTSVPAVVESVLVDVPVTTTPTVTDVTDTSAAVAAAADAVRAARLVAATQGVLDALAAGEQRLASWEPIAADPAVLTGLRDAVAAGVAVREGATVDGEAAAPVTDLDALRAVQTDLETATASHAEVVTRPDAPTTVGGIPVISKAVPLPLGYDPGMQPEVSAAFDRMAAAAAAEEGLTLFVASGYRSYDDQAATYGRWAAEHGSTYADRFSSRAGFSEHQSGLALDVNDPSRAFDGTPEATWVAANAARFGFVVRYPEGKEAITGYVYEPWHLRFLGVELATELTDAGLTLEEHLGLSADYLGGAP